MENRSFIGFGSNIDDRMAYINKGIELLESENKCSIKNVSSIYETKPYGYTEQNNFLNCVVEISTSLSLQELLNLTKNTESQIGRIKREKWGPREVDLDILFYNDLIYSDEKITVPHKDVLNRDFVLIPLCEIAPDFIHPVEKKKICELSKAELENNIIHKIEFNFT
ncbi:MAG: 2-amino-4-hydroxy-6-hydroxymethyldihydropteridine diphosphokinase [Melioribacteraceae bacterium]|nr:2-amino-4-hydroxy-6-hydroxymethyldihydropteridine diphosphokinase [Melioribacteraceae bacterium]